MQPGPSRLVTPQAQYPLQPQSTGAVLLAGTPHIARNQRVSGLRVSWKIVPAVTETLAAATRTLRSTPRSGQALGPPQRGQRNPPATGAGTDTPGTPAPTKARLEFRQIPGNPPSPAYYRLGLPESSGYPIIPEYMGCLREYAEGGIHFAVGTIIGRTLQHA